MHSKIYIDPNEEQFEIYFDMVEEGKDFLEIKRALNNSDFSEEVKDALLIYIDEAIVQYELNRSNQIQSKVYMAMAIIFTGLAFYAYFILKSNTHVVLPIGLFVLAYWAYRKAKLSQKATIGIDNTRTIRNYKRFGRFE
ncbi:MAG: hypothetical protein AAGK97_09635 [Bacteroidota bacterium]